MRSPLCLSVGLCITLINFRMAQLIFIFFCNPILSAICTSTISKLCINVDRLCGLVVRVLGYRSEGTGSIPGITKKN
jgi:hypothetical protein